MTAKSPVPDALARELIVLGTSTLYEASKLDCALPSDIQAGWAGAYLVGWALPVQTDAGDNLPIHNALALANRGSVLVVDAGGGRFGHWGEVMTVGAMAVGVAGLWINGSVRDVEAIAARNFPVFAVGRSILGTRKDCAGVVDGPITVGGTPVRPGDLIVGDGDGAVCIPAERVDEVVEASRQRAQAEQSYMARLQEGALTLDIYNLRGRG